MARGTCTAENPAIPLHDQGDVYSRVPCLWCGRVWYLEQEVVLEDPLDGLEEVGAQGQGEVEGGLPVPEKLGQVLTPHALRQGCHRTEREGGGGGWVEVEEGKERGG